MKAKLNDLMTLRDIGVLVALSPARMFQLARERGFPLPTRTLGTIRLYAPDDVAKWAKARNAARAAKRKRAA